MMMYAVAEQPCTSPLHIKPQHGSEFSMHSIIHLPVTSGQNHVQQDKENRSTVKQRPLAAAPPIQSSAYRSSLDYLSSIHTAG